MLFSVKTVDDFYDLFGLLISFDVQVRALAVLETGQPYDVGIGIGLQDLVVGKTIGLDGSFVKCPDIIGQDLT